MSVKITITIEIDDEGKVSVDTGQQREDKDISPFLSDRYEGGTDPDTEPLPQAFNPVDPDDDNLPFTLVDTPDEVSLERKPANIDDEATELIRERNNRFVKKLASDIAESPITGETVTTLIDEDLLDKINESAIQQEKEGAEGEK